MESIEELASEAQKRLANLSTSDCVIAKNCDGSKCWICKRQDRSNNQILVKNSPDPTEVKFIEPHTRSSRRVRNISPVDAAPEISLRNMLAVQKRVAMSTRQTARAATCIPRCFGSISTADTQTINTQQQVVRRIFQACFNTAVQRQRSIHLLQPA